MRSAAAPRLRAALAAGVTAFLVSSSAPGQDVWTNIGPENPRVTAVAVDSRQPGHVFAATLGGFIFQSADGGQSWQKLTFLGAAGQIRSLLVDATSKGRLYAATARRGILVSNDDGHSWTIVGNGLPPSGGWNIAVTRVPGTLYAVMDSGAFRTTNGGGTWEPIFSSSLFAVAVDPSDERRVYVGGSNGAFASSDAGRSWTPLSQLQGAFYQLLVHPDDPSTIYARGGETGQLMKSGDGGATWTSLYPFYVHSFALDNSRPRRLYATALGSGIWGGNGIVLREDTPGVMAVVGSSPYAGGWLAADPAAAGTLLLGTDDGFYRSADFGATWTRSVAGMRDAAPRALVADPVDSAALYTISMGFVDSVPVTRLFRLSEQGWVIGSAFPGLLDSLAVNPRDPLWIVGMGYQCFGWTPDGGSTWSRKDNPYQLSSATIVYDPLQPGAAYAVGNGGIYQSADRGQSWRLLSFFSWPSGLTVGRLAAFSAGQSAALFFLSPDGLNRYSAISSQWSLLTGTVSSSAVGTDPVDPSTIYLGTWDGTLRISRDAGASWTRSLPFPKGAMITAIVADPAHPARLYVGSSDGIVRSDDAGATWQDFSAGLDSRMVSNLLIDPSGQFLHAATGTGVYEYMVCAAAGERNREPCSRTRTVPFR